MKKEPDWDSKTQQELAIITAANAYHSAKWLAKIHDLLTWLLILGAGILGWLLWPTLRSFF